MPLSTPAPRDPAHTRRIECNGFRRTDGLWDIEGHLVDTKYRDITPAERPGGVIRAGEPLHEMWIRLTVDIDLLIHDVEAVTDWGPYHGCPDIAPSFQALKGLTIKSGWTQKTRELLGGVRGCTHLVELLGPVATTAFQTIYAAREKAKPAGHDGRKPGLIDTCHMYAADGRIVRDRWPVWFTGKVDKERSS
ncbi:MAG: DUF2889 domain-containing protein [Burkholderiales bacterium]|nr:DUF2889 domain-containing protein [Burkholderiales bacterium]